MANAVLSILLFLYHILEALVLKFVPRSLRQRKKIDKDIVLITGGASGLGRALAVKFAQHGARKIVVWDIDQKGLEGTFDLVEKTGAKCWPYVVDVSNSDNVYKVAAKVKDEVGKVSILVNNAGVISGATILDIPEKLVERTFKVNVLAHFWTLKAFLPDMLTAKRGHVVTVASVAGYGGGPRMSDYCASKAATHALDESLRLELLISGHKAVKVTIVNPWLFDSGLFKGVNPGLIPALSTSSLADQVILAVLTNQEVLTTPAIFSSIPIVKQMLPWKCYCILINALGFTRAMDTFTGRPRSGASSKASSETSN